VAFTSPDDAFPGDVPRPLQPNLNLRSFTITPTLATHVQLRVLTTQCTGQAKFAGDQDDDPFNNSDCSASASGPIARATELQVFSSCNRVNVAAAAAGATASASSTYPNGNFPESSTIDGDRTGNGWGMGTGGWNDGTLDAWPDSLEVDFNGSKTIDEIRVYTLQANWTTAGEPDLTTSASGEGILNFDVQTWNNTTSAWETIPNGSVMDNDKAMRVFTLLTPITTTKIQVVVTRGRNFWSRIVEVEAFTCP